MKHLNSARELANKRGPISRILSVLLFVNLIVSTHSGAAAALNDPHFSDPTAVIQCGPPFKLCSLGSSVYIGPFATLKTGPSSGGSTPFITIGNSSDVQDNTLLDTTTNNRPITLGDTVIIAHGASVFGGASIGTRGECPPSIYVCASFVGFNSEVAEDAVVERNAMVTHLARVGPGVTIPSGRVVLPGKNVRSNSEVPAKTIEITDADRQFMDAVIHVNIAFAAGYTELQRKDPTDVRGVNFNPVTDFTPTSTLPSLAGQPIRNPSSPNRIIGDVRFADAAMPRMGRNVSLRADEGTPFRVGRISLLADFTTFHALEHTELSLGDNGRYGVGSLMHGGKFNNNITSTGINFELGNDSVFYSSTAADNCRIGAMSFVSDTNLPANTIIPAKRVVLAGQMSVVEWDRRPHKKTKNSRGKGKR
jgi:carbonic anhydrase/acetyltransferase-like protein (isoleucine patch superfamily)